MNIHDEQGVFHGRDIGVSDKGRNTAGIPAIRTGRKAIALRRASIPCVSFVSATGREVSGFLSALKPGQKVNSRGESMPIGMPFVSLKTPGCLP